MSESQGHRLHREGTGAELLQEGRSLLVRLRRDGTAIYRSSRVALATVSNYLQPSPNISKHRQRDSDLAIPDSTSPPQMANSREPLNMIDCIEPSKLYTASDANVGRRGTIRIPGVETANFLGRILQVLGGFPRTVVGAISDPADKVFQLVPKYLGV